MDHPGCRCAFLLAYNYFPQHRLPEMEGANSKLDFCQRFPGITVFQRKASHPTYDGARSKRAERSLATTQQHLDCLLHNSWSSKSYRRIHTK